MRSVVRKIARYPTAIIALAGAAAAYGQDAPAPAAAPVVAPTPAGPAVVPPAGQPRPFKDVVKDAKRLPGYFPLYQKDDKVWIEIASDRFRQAFFFTWNITRSVGERGLYGGQMGGFRVAEFRKIGNHVQLVARNMERFAQAGTPQARVVAESFSDSLVTSASAASQPHPESKAILVEANALLFVDIPGYLSRIEAAFRQSFALDTRNTSIAAARNTDELTGIEVEAHFAVPRLAIPSLTPSLIPQIPPPRAAPDPRSFFASFLYSFTALPSQPMRPRIADERIGHFVASRYDYNDDTAVKRQVNFVRRWRLEKNDPAATVSEPKQPIVYWLDRNIPEKYRQSVTEGVLEWNKAFERIGFRNALAVKQQGEKDDFNTLDARHASIRWFTGADVGFAIGPSHHDPRTGEILDADIATGDGFPRLGRRTVLDDLGREPAADPLAAWIADPLNAHRGWNSDAYMACRMDAHSQHELEFAVDVLEARGLDVTSAEAEALAQAHLRRNVMHEVGHTLGLRHNFRGSAVYSLKQIQDPEFTRANGVVASIMEYMPFNIALSGEKQGEYVNSTLGPYDYWAIEYAYRELEPATEATELERIAVRSTEPELAYGTDEDAGTEGQGVDPQINRFDLGSDPLEYYRKRLQLNRELWERMQALELKPGESYERLTRSLVSGFRQLALIAPLASKYVGGVTLRRDRAGTSRPLHEPVPVAKQREALALITRNLLQADSFRFKPEFLSRIAVDHFASPRGSDFSLNGTVLNVHKSVLDQLMSDAVAARLLESREKVSDASKVLGLAELNDTLTGAIWSELKAGEDIPLLRRNLQREHLRRVAGMLTRGAGATPADARALARENARALLERIRRAAAGAKLSREARAHLSESANTLDEALKASMQRAST